MNDPTGEIHGALAADDPIRALRTLAIDLAARGHSQAVVEVAFGSVAGELFESGREREAELVVEVLDMMAEWYAGGRPID